MAQGIVRGGLAGLGPGACSESFLVSLKNKTPDLSMRSGLGRGPLQTSPPDVLVNVGGVRRGGGSCGRDRPYGRALCGTVPMPSSAHMWSSDRT